MSKPHPEPISIELDLNLRLWDHGGSGEPILFLHGYLDNGRSYDAIAERLPAPYRALCLDWRGHGESQWVGPGGSYHLLDHLKDLNRVLHWLDENQMVPKAIVAHSMGGNIASMLTGIRPDRVQRLFLLDALLPPPEEPETQPERLERVLINQEHVKEFRTFSSREDAAARIMKTNIGLSELGAKRMAEHALCPDETTAGQFKYRLDPRLRGPTPVRYPESMWLELCARMQANVFLLRSEHGYVPMNDVTQARLKQIKRMTVATIDHVGHHLHVEDPDCVVEHILRFMAHEES